MTDFLSAPVMSCINITDYCNLSCSYCYAHNDNKVFMPPAKVVEIVAEFHARGVWQLVLGGGEPFLHPDVVEILRQILSRHIAIGIITNGTVIRRSQIEALSRLYAEYPSLLSIQVSVDGPTPELNDIFRQKGERVFRAIALLASKGIAISTGTVVHKYNAHCVHEIIDNLYPRVKKFHFMELMPSYNVRQWSEHCFADRDTLARTYSTLRSYRSRYRDIALTLPDLAAVTSDIDHPSLKCEGCTAAVTRMDINADGTLLACNIADQSVIGNAHTQSLDSAWRSAAADRYRRDSLPICKKQHSDGQSQFRAKEHIYPISSLKLKTSCRATHEDRKQAT